MADVAVAARCAARAAADEGAKAAIIAAVAAGKTAHIRSTAATEARAPHIGMKRAPSAQEAARKYAARATAAAIVVAPPALATDISSAIAAAGRATLCIQET